MSAASQPLPSVTVTELAAATAFAATGIPDFPVFMGPCGGSYAVNTPVLFNSGDITSLQALFPNGPAVKECALAVVQVAQPFFFMRMTTATVGTLLTTPVVVKNVSSTWTSVLTGVALDGADILITFTLGGTTGTGPITYTVSIGGVVGSPISLATATTIVVLGVTLTLGSAHVVTTGDTIAWQQWPPSSTVLPLTFVGTGTSVITVTGTPLDRYEVGFQVLTGGTIGVTGIIFRYCLDYTSASPTWTQPQSLGTATTFLLLDGPISQASTGLTLNFAAGTLVAQDLETFNTSSPAYDSAGLVAAIAALSAAYNNGTAQWTWIRAVGPVPEALAASADAIMLATDLSTEPTWMVVDALGKAGGTQVLSAWEAYTAATYAQFTSTHVGVAAGRLRGFDPINGRLNPRSCMAFFVARAMGADGTTIATDWAQFSLGSLPADVTMVDSTGAAVEHNANQNPTLQAMGFITARTWPGESGVYPTKASLLGPVNDIQRIPLRRVMNLAKKLERNGLRIFAVREFRQWTSQPGALQAKSPYKAGDVYQPDVEKTNLFLNDLLTVGIFNKGYCSSIEYALNPTPTSNGGGSYGLNGAMQITSLIYVDTLGSTAQFVGAVT